MFYARTQVQSDRTWWSSPSRGGNPLGIYKTALGMKGKQGHVLLQSSRTGAVGEVAPLPSGLVL